MTTSLDLYRVIAPLTDERRIEARARARSIVTKDAGDMPARADFDNHTEAKYPQWVNRLIIGLCVIVLAAAFAPSAIRLYAIGSMTFAEAIPHQASAVAAGIAMVIMAETAQVLFSLAVAVMDASKTAKRLLYVSMFGATVLALVGNGQVSLPGHETNPFAWLESFMPPLLVLSTAYILKEQMLVSIAQRHANTKAHQEALSVWNMANAQPERHPRYRSALANALRDAIKEENVKGTGANARRELMAALDMESWKLLVKRELSADDWYTDPSESIAPIAPNQAQEGYSVTIGNTEAQALTAPRQTRTRRAAAPVEAVSIDPSPVLHQTADEAIASPFLAQVTPSQNGNGTH